MVSPDSDLRRKHICLLLLVALRIYSSLGLKHDGFESLEIGTCAGRYALLLSVSEILVGRVHAELEARISQVDDGAA